MHSIAQDYHLRDLFLIRRRTSSRFTHDIPTISPRYGECLRYPNHSLDTSLSCIPICFWIIGGINIPIINDICFGWDCQHASEQCKFQPSFYIIPFLVGGIPTRLKNMSSSVGMMIIPKSMENIKVMTVMFHSPPTILFEGFRTIISPCYPLVI